jgi:hypothetical protein
MNPLIDEQLRHSIHEDSDCQHMTDGCKPTLKQFLSLLRMKEQSEKVRRLPLSCVSQPATHSKQNGKEWLQDEPEAPGTRETLWQVLQKLLGEQVNTAGLKCFLNCPGERCQDHQDDKRC